MAVPILTNVLNADLTGTITYDLVAAAPVIENALAKVKAGFSLPALLKLIEDLATDLPVIIADVTAVFAAPAPGPGAIAPHPPKP